MFSDMLYFHNFRYVGNVHVQVTEALLREVFQSTGLVEGCKLIRKEKVCFHYLIFLFISVIFLKTYPLWGDSV